MLSERVCKALTAYVDGDAPRHLRKAVLTLVRRSAEARAYLDKLRRDRERLRALPRQQLGPDFAARVVQKIGERRLSPRRVLRFRPQPRRAVSAWAGVVAAAATLLMIGGVSYFYFAQVFEQGTPGTEVSRVNGAGDTGTGQPDGRNHPAENTNGNPPGPERSGLKDPPVPPQINVALTPKDEFKDLLPLPGQRQGDEPLGGPIPRWELFGPRSASVTLPLVQRQFELNATDMRQELGQDTGFRIELPCRESARAFERLQAACKAQGLSLLVDQVVQTRFKRPDLHTNFVLFTEELTPDELIKLLEQVVADEKKADVKRKGDGTLYGMLVFRMDKDDRGELADLLGIDPRQVQGGRYGNPLNIDPKIPLSELTAKEIGLALSGQGSPGRGTDSVKGTGKGSEQRVLVLPYNPVRVKPGSAEVKHFLDGRKPLRTGAIQILLVVREVKS